MGISVKSAFSAQAKIKEMRERNAQRLGTAMSDAATQISTRTNQGQGADGALKPYSNKQYFDSKGERINFITKKGKVRPLESYREYKVRTKGTDKVNLTESGDMLRGMQTELDTTSEKLRGRIYFLKDQVMKARWNQALRNFFALSNEQIETIKRKLRGQ